MLDNEVEGFLTSMLIFPLLVDIAKSPYLSFIPCRHFWVSCHRFKALPVILLGLFLLILHDGVEDLLRSMSTYRLLVDLPMDIPKCPYLGFMPCWHLALLDRLP